MFLNMNFQLQTCVSDILYSVWFEPTCLLKAKKPFSSDAWQNITYTSPNLNELRTMNLAVTKQPDPRWKEEDNQSLYEKTTERKVEDIIDECLHLCQPLLSYIHCVIVTLGKDGILVCRNTPADIPFPTSYRRSDLPTKQQYLVSALHFPTSWDQHHPPEIVNITGAGDR